MDSFAPLFLLPFIFGLMATTPRLNGWVSSFKRFGILVLVQSIAAAVGIAATRNVLSLDLVPSAVLVACLSWAGIRFGLWLHNKRWGSIVNYEALRAHVWDSRTCLGRLVLQYASWRLGVPIDAPQQLRLHLP